mgnify:CR=1 FL=1
MQYKKQLWSNKYVKQKVFSNSTALSDAYTNPNLIYACSFTTQETFLWDYKDNVLHATCFSGIRIDQFYHGELLQYAYLYVFHSKPYKVPLHWLPKIPQMPKKIHGEKPTASRKFQARNAAIPKKSQTRYDTKMPNAKIPKSQWL